jgi:Fic family protein
MNPREFERSPSGFLVPTVYDQRAFVPHPLPPQINLNRCMIEVDRASRAMAELKGMSYKVTNPLHLINPLQQREAIASSSIEGTYTTATDLLLFDPSHGSASADPDTREVFNYVTALQEGLESLGELPISSRLIKKLHAALLRGVKRHRGSEIVPGEYKRDQNFIGSRTRGINQARFVPPPPALTPQLMGDLEKFINSGEARNLPPVIVNALVHYQFETIHPFPDGNGRVGRLLLPLILAAHDVMPIPLLYISPFIEKHKDEYNDSMLEVSKNGSWEEWICFFAEAIKTSATDTMRKIDEIAKLRDQFIQQAQQARASGLLPALIDLVFDSLVISIPQTAKRLGVTYRAAQNNIEKLVQYGMLSNLRSRGRPKLFICQPLVRIALETEAPAEPAADERTKHVTDETQPLLL